MVPAEQAMLLASANKLSSVASASLEFLAKLRGTLTFFSCLQSHSFFSSQAPLYMCFPSAIVGDNMPNGS